MPRISPAAERWTPPPEAASRLRAARPRAHTSKDSDTFEINGVSSGEVLAPPTLLDRAHAEGLGSVDINHGITGTYVKLAPVFQALVDPGFGAAGTSKVDPTWFAFGEHASNDAGAGMGAAHAALDLCNLLERGDRDGLRKAADAQLTPSQKAFARGLQAQMGLLGVPRDVGLILGVFAVTNFEAFRHPVTTLVAGYRLAMLFLEAKGDPLERVRAICLTGENMLTGGNQAIFRDIGGSGYAYLGFRKSNPELDPETVLTSFSLPGSDPARAKQVYEACLAHLADAHRPDDFTALAPTAATSNDLVVAGFALYELAGNTTDVLRKNELISVANNLLAFREQRDAVAPAFTVQGSPEEVPRERLMALLTPGMEVNFGAVRWKFSDWAAHQPHGSLENWAMFQDRWPAILNAFDAVYARPEDIWKNIPQVTVPNV